jgi:TRAP-type C4-dicarboxylate transport system substrate-binding protein
LKRVQDFPLRGFVVSLRLLTSSPVSAEQEKTVRIINVVVAVGICSLCLGSISTRAQERAILKVLGQPITAGKLQRDREQPFFETLATKFGLPFQVEYVPLDSLQFSDVDPLAALRSDTAQIASLRISQTGQQEPALLGLDLVGMNLDGKLARQVTDAYVPVVDRRLQEKFGVKLLGTWPFGPEVLFCNKPIGGLGDIKGFRVRVYNLETANLIELAGGTAVQLGFGATYRALSAGDVDCAIGSPTGAVASGWPAVTTHVLPIAFQLGINAYGISLSAWTKMPTDQQVKLTSALRSLTEDMWSYSEALTEDSIGCSVGTVPCGSGGKFRMVKIPVTAADVTLLREALRKISFPHWAEACDAVDPNCSGRWKKAVGPLVGLK